MATKIKTPTRETTDTLFDMLRDALAETDAARIDAAALSARKAAIIDRLRAAGLTYREIGEAVGIGTQGVAGFVYRNRKATER